MEVTSLLAQRDHTTWQTLFLIFYKRKIGAFGAFIDLLHSFYVLNIDVRASMVNLLFYYYSMCSSKLRSNSHSAIFNFTGSTP